MPDTLAESADATRLETILARQRAAFAADGAVSLELRLDRLGRLVRLITENGQEIAETVRSDYAGARSMHWTLLSELVSKTAGVEHAIAHLAEWMKTERRQSNQPFEAMGATSEVVMQPKGVVGIISPWNMPFGLTVAPLTSALAAGNRVMIKPSELTPETSQLFVRLFGAYFDETEVAVVTGGPDVGAAFSGLAFDHLLYTGSTAVGRKIMRNAAENLVPVTLELGGKCPVIVGRSADLDRLGPSLAFSKTLNGGQLCLSPDYVLAPREQAQGLVDRLVTELSDMYPTVADNPDITGIVNAAHYDRLEAHVADARAKGARVTVVGEVPAGQNTRRMPVHILQDVTRDMTVMQEEIFGPLLPIVPYDQIDEAIGYVAAGDTPLGLYYFGQDAAEEAHVLAHTRSGGVTVNDILQHYVQEDLPFGGLGASGVGAYHGRDGFLTFSHQRAVFRQAGHTMASLFRPPFTPELLTYFQGELARRAPADAAVS